MVEIAPALATNLAQTDTPKGYDQVVRFLGDQLRSGTLKAGDRLLPERELALRLNISRPIVREALRSLAMIGVLEIQQGRGTFVRAPDFAALGQFFSFMFVQQGEDLDDIMELRQGLERQAIRLACARARTRDLERIAEALDGIRNTIDDPVAGGKADFLFHTRLVEASHSQALIRIYAVVSRILEDNHVLRRRRIAATETFQDYLIDHHALLFKAVQRRDVEESEKLLIRHFEIGDQLNNAGFEHSSRSIT